MPSKTVALHTDEKGRNWWLMEREDGSVSIYFTYADTVIRGVHFVVFDDLDYRVTPVATDKESRAMVELAKAARAMMSPEMERAMRKDLESQ